VNKFQIPFEGRQITLVDTPGFADTSISDTDVLKMIAGFMEESYEQDVLLSGIIYLHQITHNRVEGPSLRNINMFQKLCGDNGLRNVVLATTMWDTASTDKEIERFVEREQELTQDFWDRMIEKGSQVRRYWNDRDTAEQLIRELIQHTPIALDIQSELVDEHKNLADTAAGSYIDEGLEQLHQKYQEDLDEYYKMMQTSKPITRPLCKSIHLLTRIQVPNKQGMKLSESTKQSWKRCISMRKKPDCFTNKDSTRWVNSGTSKLAPAPMMLMHTTRSSKTYRDPLRAS
jgi:hypothetical protein